jgi:DNA polymerase-3 subunit epsilon
LLVEELLRAEVDFDFKNNKTVDVQTIFHKMEQRTLTAALRFYCNEELTDAHSAHADTKATHDVLIAQLDRYQELEPNIAFLNEFSSRRKTVDFAGFVVYNKDEEACFGFGKHKGKKVTDILANEPGYFGWVMNADFPRYTKKILTEIRLSQMNTNL